MLVQFQLVFAIDRLVGVPFRTGFDALAGEADMNGPLRPVHFANPARADQHPLAQQPSVRVDDGPANLPALLVEEKILEGADFAIARGNFVSAALLAAAQMRFDGGASRCDRSALFLLPVIRDAVVIVCAISPRLEMGACRSIGGALSTCSRCKLTRICSGLHPRVFTTAVEISTSRPPISAPVATTM